MRTQDIEGLELKSLVNIENRIGLCRKKNLKAEPWKYDSTQLLGMTIFVKAQARGTPVKVKIDGPAAPFFEQGKKFYYQRRGQLDMACARCHEKYFGQQIRMDILSQGHSSGFPTYRLKWQKPGSLPRRFSGCNKQVGPGRSGRAARSTWRWSFISHGAGRPARRDPGRPQLTGDDRSMGGARRAGAAPNPWRRTCSHAATFWLSPVPRRP